MIATTFLLLALTGAALAQYPQQLAPSAPSYGYQQYPQSQQYQPQQYQQQPQQYQQQPQQYQQPQQQYQPAPQQQQQQQQQQRSYGPAPVHYVNIGSQLQGDYKFGYDTGRGNDGQSFREETRLPDGSVQGAYGYVDETGKQRIVRYTAGKDGYRAEGDGIAPPTAPAQNHQAPQNQENYASGNYQQYSR